MRTAPTFIALSLSFALVNSFSPISGAFAQEEKKAEPSAECEKCHKKGKKQCEKCKEGKECKDCKSACKKCESGKSCADCARHEHGKSAEKEAVKGDEKKVETTEKK